MSDINSPENQPKHEAYTPASPVKRALAWIGVVYMVILVALMTYFYFTATMLTGLGPLLTIPGLVGLGIVAILSYRTTGQPGKKAVILVALMTYFYFTATMLTGLGPLLTVPGLVGLGIVAILSYRTTGQPSKKAVVLLAAVCWLLALLSLPVGIAGLMTNFV